MKYYLFDYPVGPKEPFIEGMTEKYWRKVPTNETIRDIPYFMFPSFNPFLDAYDLDEDQVLRDYISTIHDNAGLLVSDKMKTVLEAANLPDHRFYPAVIQHGKKRVTNYWFFKMVWDPFDFVDYQSSKIVFYRRKNGLEKPPILIDSLSKMRYALEYAERNRIGRTFKHGGKLYFNQKFNEIDLDFFYMRHLIPHLLVSERLKTAIEAAGLTGIEFRKTDLIQTA